MSNYRDDTQETAVASATAWGGLTAIVEESALAVAALMFSVGVMHSADAVAADEVIDKAYSVTIEQAAAVDAVLDTKQGRDLALEQGKAADLFTGRLRVLHTDAAVASDQAMESLRSIVAESALASDQAFPQRSVTTLISESAHASDTSSQVASELVAESAVAADWHAGTTRAQDVLSDAAGASVEVFGGQQAAVPVTEVATVFAQVFDHLAAAGLIEEVAVVTEHGWSNLPEIGQAWTANADGWAMSRYAPLAFTSLAVINGVAYGMSADGVYALDGDTETIGGSLQTGKLDIGRGGLVHPLGAYLEYELNGTAQMDVTTTQSGAAETYTYDLPAESAGELTNGRFVFGRGLRGRHFSFALRITGTHGYINDLSVNSAPTKRRV